MTSPDSVPAISVAGLTRRYQDQRALGDVSFTVPAGTINIKVSQALRAASWCCPNRDAALASSLLADFGVRANKPVKSLSRGQRSALGITIGLAAHAEVTLFDEPYAGLDAVARQIFYDRLLADFAEFPRTVLLSTHLIDEAAAMFERWSSSTGR